MTGVSLSPSPVHVDQLPVVGGHLVAARRGADDHAEHGLRAVPVHVGLAHRDGPGALHAGHPVARGGREVLQRPARIANPQVAAARRVGHRPLVVRDADPMVAKSAGLGTWVTNRIGVDGSGPWRAEVTYRT